MWFLTWVSTLYGDFQQVMHEYPMFLGIWSAVVWGVSLIPRNWVLQKLRRAWPWDQVAMADAGAHLLGSIDGGLLAEQIRREKTPEETLNFIANYVANYAQVTGVMPPSTHRITVSPYEFKRGVFEDAGNTFRYHHDKSPKFVNITVYRWRLWRATKEIKRAQASVWPDKSPVE